MVKKSCIKPSFTCSNKLTVGHPKTRLEFIKDVIDSLDSDCKEIEAVSAASYKGIADLPGKKENDSIVPVKTTQPSVAKDQGKYSQSV